MRALIAAPFLLLAGCVIIPAGPSVRVLPGPNKPFDVFVRDDAYCRQFAAQQTGIAPTQSAADNVAAGAAVGTVVGAAAGALVDGGHGAAVGAATGLVVGTAAGSSGGYYSSYTLQRRYDIAYQQCMYAYGNQVPGAPAPSAPPPPPPPPSR
ncbi:MAG TPA: YMGG-like glycine zipper-containing protein [Rhodocyclaceae bacterium]|jgi:hypothetical protein|nr:YMGG-like glycine zipper-containing protein [Rhodocyclaceae bacterium]